MGTLILPLQQVDGFLNNLAGFVHHAVVLVHVPEVTGDEGLELQFEHGHGSIALLVILGFDALGHTVLDDGIDKLVGHLEALLERGEVGIGLLQFLAVVVDIAQVLLDDGALGSQLAVVLGVAHGVEGYEVVGHDASAAIDGTVLLQRVVLQ